MKIQNVLTALLCSAALVSCGGGGSGGGSTSGGGGTPTPSPTPTPTPTFTYTKYADLTGDQSFATACVDGEGSPIGTIGNAFPKPMGDSGSLSYVETTDTWTIANVFGKSESFGPGELVETNTNFDRYEKPSGFGPNEQFQLFRNNETGIDFEYMRSAFGLLFEAGTPPGYSSCFFGVPTDPDDVPSEATVTYTNLRFGGIVIEEAPGQTPPSTLSTIVGGSGTLTGDTQNGELTIDISLTVEDSGGVQTTITPIQGSVATEINGDVAGYSGLLNAGGSPEYTIAGGYFGPEGRETGFTFLAVLDQNFDGVPELSIFGAVAAKR